MKSTGTVRGVDELGRVVIPREILKTHNITPGKDELEIYVEGERIIIEKYCAGCIICGSVEGVAEIRGIGKVCAACGAIIKGQSF